ncbi:hypothetical protein GCM10027162_66120 [Streptomyces incanus]
MPGDFPWYRVAQRRRTVPDPQPAQRRLRAAGQLARPCRIGRGRGRVGEGGATSFSFVEK